MQKSSHTDARRGIFLCLLTLGLVTVVTILPARFGASAAQKGFVNRTVSADPTLPNYDIRDDANEKGVAAVDALMKYRQSTGRSAAMIADVRDSFVRGENSLRARVPTLKVEYNQDIRIPEVIGPDVWQGRNFLTGATAPAGGKHADVLLNFLKENDQLIGATEDQVSQLKVAADYTNPNGQLSYVELDQQINGIPVFRGEVKAGFTKAGEMIRVINNFAPGIDYSSVSPDFGNASDAVKMAANNIKWTLKETDAAPNAAASTDNFVRFGNGGDWDVTAEKMYFPTEPGVAVPAWRVLIWEPVSAYYVIVDANSGTVLWRKNIANDQTQSATYSVYSAPGSANALGLGMDSPAPGNPIPGAIDPTIATPFQAGLGVRTNVSLIGNEGALSFNNLGWITDGTNGVDGFTDGNAVQAGLDIDGVNGVDAPQNGTARVFNFVWVPSNVTAGVEGGVAANDPTARSGAVTNLFYLDNRYHDALYQVGFTEAARNFQNDNFGRGGVANDRVSAEAQDSSGTNNANFSTPADGGRGRMQMFVFTNGTAPSRDGDLDSNVVWHEHTHGVSNRLIGNGSGLTTTRSGGSGEGWSDLYAFLLGSKNGDATTGVYSTGAYVTYKCCGLSTYTQNYFYGIRRFPYSPMSNHGGPGNKPYNPLTLIDIQANTNGGNGAFPCSPLIGCNGSPTEVHNQGEVWAETGVEVWARLVSRLGRQTGTLKTLQLYTDGMKLSPLNPTFIQSRDSVIAAAAASPLAPEASADVVDVREGFRIRGMGFSATDTGTAVVEAFDTPNVRSTNPITVSDSPGDHDGFPEPGENVLVSVPVLNPSTGAPISNVQVNINGGTNVSYGTINDGATVTNAIPLLIPANVTCGSLFQITINVTSSAGAQTPTTFSFRVGAPVGGAPATFSNSTAITINDAAPASPYPSNITVSGLSGNKVVKVKFTGITHTFPGDLDFLLVSPAGQKYIILSDSGSSGGVTAVDITMSDAAATQPSTSQWVTGEFKPYNSGIDDPFAAPAPVGPYKNAAPAGTDTIASAFGSSGATMNGTWSLYLVDDAGGDVGTVNGGWSLTFEANDFVCQLAAVNKTPYDFDGDHKTDVSIFRPGANAQWWYSRSSDNQVVAGVFGGTGDVPTPGDYTGDGKTDISFFRPSTGQFFVLRSEDNTFLAFPWGANGDIPTPADFDGDGKVDAAVFRPSTGLWFISPSGGGAAIITQFGTNGDQPVAADYDNDGKADIGIVRTNGANKEWWILRSTAGLIATVFGQPTDKATPGDYTGDGKADIAFFRPSTGQWFILRSEDLTFLAFTFGQAGDIPAPGDYDGDGKFDSAVFRPSNATWFVNRTGGAGVLTQGFGAASDIPVPNVYVR